MSDLLIGNTVPSDIFIGCLPVNAVYVNKTLVWQAGVFVYFDSGSVDGITWKANALTRSGYTSYAAASVTATYLQLSTSARDTTYAHNAHVIMTVPAKIPKGVTKLCMKVYCQSGGYGFSDGSSLKLGLVPANATATSSMITIATGNCSTTSYDSLAEAKTISGNCSAYAGSNNYKIIVHGVQVPRSGGSRVVRISKIWFE